MADAAYRMRREKRNHADEETWLRSSALPFPPGPSAASEAEARRRSLTGLGEGIRRAEAGCRPWPWAHTPGCPQAPLGSDSSLLGDDAPHSDRHPFPQPGRDLRSGRPAAASSPRSVAAVAFTLRTGSSLPLVVREGNRLNVKKRAACFRIALLFHKLPKGSKRSLILE